MSRAVHDCINTIPLVPLRLCALQFEDIQQMTQLKWDLQTGKDYYTGETGVSFRCTFSDPTDPHRIVWTKQSSALTAPVVCDDALSKLEGSLHSSSLIEGGGNSETAVVDM